METADVSKRVRQLIREAQDAARTRREQAAVAERTGTSALTEVVTPVAKTIAAALTAEGYSFRVSTPSGAVRLGAEASADDFVEVTVDTQRNPPGLIARVSRRWGRRVLVDEHVLREGAAITDVTSEDTLEFLLGVLGPFVER